jgi:fimbrial chaperone protein
MPRNAIRAVLCTFALALGWIAAAPAAEFVISPLLVTLSRAAKSTQIDIRNEDKSPLRIQMQAMEWSQDAEGNNQYAESDALLYFPKAMEIPAGESRIIRLAARALPASVEDAYRLYIEELPGAPEGGRSGGGGADVRILLRVGVAVFVEPLAPKASGEIESLELRGNVAELTVHNTGNVHIAADRLALVGLGRDGKQLFATPLNDRYFLAGATRRLRAPIPAEHCAQLTALEAVVVSPRIDLKRRLDV